MQTRIENQTPYTWGRARSGLTLLEVLIALGIFVASIATMSQLTAIGQRAATGGRLNTRAALLAEAKMAELIVGFEEMASGGNVFPPEYGSGWTWELEAVEDGAGVLVLTLTVAHQTTGGTVNGSFTLVRMVRDPSVIADMVIAAEEAAAEAEEEEYE